MKQVMKELTREFHLILEQFLSYRNECTDKISFLDKCRLKYTEAVLAYAMKVPVMEATYAMWEQTPFKTYDCLIPLTQNY